MFELFKKYLLDCSLFLSVAGTLPYTLPALKQTEPITSQIVRTNTAATPSARARLGVSTNRTSKLFEHSEIVLSF